MLRCEVCTEAWQALFGFYCRQQQALIVEEAAQEEFLGSVGFCPSHCWMLVGFSSPKGLSATYPKLMEKVATQLNSFLGRSGDEAGEGLRDLLRQRAQCAACGTQAQVVSQTVLRIRGDLNCGHGGNDASISLCLHHLQSVLMGLDAGRASTLLRAHAERAARAAVDMHGYAFKFDALRRDLIIKPEHAAYRDALVLLAGERNLASLPMTDRV